MKPFQVRILVLAAILLAIAFLARVFISRLAPPAPPISSFAECAAAGQPVMESYPRQCRAPDGTLYVENIGNELEKADLIRLDAPRPNQVLTSPAQIAGEARGGWFFEANFPIRLLDEGGKEIAVALARAQGDWMTEDFVPFQATLTFTRPETPTGTLVLEKANPSGLEENADELVVPVRFSEP
jgi:hypothetical protein